MLQRAGLRLGASGRMLAKRNFTTSMPRKGGYHYPEGPRSNLPFNPLTRFFYLRYIAFCVTGFGLPFGIAVWQTKKKEFL